MPFKTHCTLLITLLLVSCQNENKELIVAQQKDAQKREVVFSAIERGWVFDISPLEGTTQAKINNWVEWRNFLTEINQKPKSTIGAFQKKAAVLSKKAMELELTVPAEFNKQQIKSRISVIITKVKSLDLYIHLRQIPEQKVIKLVNDLNTEIDYFQLQMEEIVKRSQIPVEEGEQDLIKMKDTSRAIPN
ncbi:hypothetical protein [Flavobacterium sp.]|uniref:hypothetical protein n=1 Tax=Flavobacterium sp. TaxID=239 RepID=UPI0038CFC2AB